MKKIHLIRHGKSSWKDGSLSDHDRPLNKRGVKSCRIMAPHIQQAGCTFQHVYCSTAVRAESTIEHISLCLPGMDIHWQRDPALYTFSTHALFSWFRQLDEALTDVVVIGHNPALTDFCNQVSMSDIENLPTCSYAQLHFDGSWKDLSTNSVELVCLLKPKQFRTLDQP